MSVLDLKWHSDVRMVCQRNVRDLYFVESWEQSLALEAEEKSSRFVIQHFGRWVSDDEKSQEQSAFSTNSPPREQSPNPSQINP